MLYFRNQLKKTDFDIVSLHILSYRGSIAHIGHYLFLRVTKGNTLRIHIRPAQWSFQKKVLSHVCIALRHMIVD